MKWVPYKKYKASHIPWLGDVPDHWGIRPLRTVLLQRNEKNSPVKTEQILSLSIAGGVTLYSHEGRGGNKRKADVSAYKIARVGDIVLNSMNVIVGAVGLSRYTGAISPVYYALFPATDEVDIRYYDKVFENSSFQRYLLIYGKGILIKKSNTGKLNTIRMKISPDDLKSTLLPIPPKEEQRQIARFLDWQSSRIKKFIRSKLRLIELLKEQKQNTINHAVTWGVDPTVELRPSGVEWIGDIPAHWELRRLKYLCRNVNRLASRENRDEVYIALEHVEAWTGRISLPREHVSFDSQVKRFEIGDVLFGKLRPYLAKVTKPTVPGVCVGEFLVLRPFQESLSGEYLEKKLRSRDVIDVINRSTFGAKMPRADWAVIGNLQIAYPPPNEQRDILVHIERRSEEVDQAIARAKREIELVREYGTRLTSDVVTGQLDVRGIEVPEITAEEIDALGEAPEKDEQLVCDEAVVEGAQ